MEKLKPGKMIFADKRGPLVGAADGALLLQEVQLEGKRRMTRRNLRVVKVDRPLRGRC